MQRLRCLSGCALPMYALCIWFGLRGGIVLRCTIPATPCRTMYPTFVCQIYDAGVKIKSVERKQEMRGTDRDSSGNMLVIALKWYSEGTGEGRGGPRSQSRSASCHRYDLFNDLFQDSRGVRISAPDQRWLLSMARPSPVCAEVVAPAETVRCTGRFTCSRSAELSREAARVRSQSAPKPGAIGSRQERPPHLESFGRCVGALAMHPSLVSRQMILFFFVGFTRHQVQRRADLSWHPLFAPR